MQGAPVRLRCEYLSDPLGIDSARPRLAWWSGDERPAELQTAYQILAASHPDLLAMDEGDLWDTGRVEGRSSAQIEYQGKPLISGRRVWWKVRSYDSDGLPSPWSEPATFELGLLEPTDWGGRWISAGLSGSRLTSVPVPLLGRSFELKTEPQRARLYIAARGHFSVRLNNVPLTDELTTAGWVDWRRRAEYLTFDVTDRLEAGLNRLAVLLADGWYAGDPGTGVRQQYGDRPQLLVELRVRGNDGSEFRLSSDSGWRWRPSWILAADPSRGETVDGHQQPEDWLPGETSELGWYPVEQGARATDETLSLSAAGALPVAGAPREMECVRWQPNAGAALFDLGESIIGRASLKLKEPDAGAFRVRYGLTLDETGALMATGEDAHVAGDSETPAPCDVTFSLQGFRYLEVSGDLYREDALSVDAVPVAVPMAADAVLVADHPRLNQLFDRLTAHLRATRQGASFRGLGPRDRIGDVAAAGAETGALLLTLDSVPAVVDWVRDMLDAQFPEGLFPAVVPALPAEEGWNGEGAAGASETFIETLWHLYRHTGDRRLLRQTFPAVKQLLAGSLGRAVDFIREDLDADSAYPADLAATAWFYRGARLAARIAGVLGNLTDLEDCEELAANVRNAFRRRFVTPDGRIIGDNAAVSALTLAFGLLDRAEQRTAREVLFQAVTAALNGTALERRLLLETPWLLTVLGEQGRLDLAYRLLLETPFIGEPALGGTDMARLLRAGVAEWLFGTLSGFAPSRDLSERQNAYRHVLIEPRPPLGLGYGEVAGEPPVRAVEAELATQSGRFEASWRISEEAFDIQVLVPGNCSAEVVLPDGTAHAVEAGAHEFSMPFGEAGDGIPILREVS